MPTETRDDDVIQPFLIDSSGLRGRAIRLGKSIQDILARHDYPDPISRLLGEMLVLTAMLSSTLKFNGILTMQVNGDGPVRFMVADTTFDGQLRGYAEFDHEDPVFLTSNDTLPSMSDLLGEGYFAITIDPGGDSERYQGIVPLIGNHLSECVTAYFEQSEQLDVAMRVEVGHSREHGEKCGWEGAAIMLQKLPGEGGNMDSNIVFLDFGSDTSSLYSGETWNRAVTLMRTATKEELLDPFLPLQDLLYRLYHEDGVRIFDTLSVVDSCRCSRERIHDVLSTLSAGEIQEMLDEAGQMSVTCQFCNREEVFTEQDFFREG